MSQEKENKCKIFNEKIINHAMPMQNIKYMSTMYYFLK